jgi:hypothetical protein
MVFEGDDGIIFRYGVSSLSLYHLACMKLSVLQESMSSKALPLQHFWSLCSLTKRRDGTSERSDTRVSLARTQKTARGVRRSQKSTARAKPELRWLVGGQDGW